MSTLVSQSSILMAHDLDERRERAEIRAEVPQSGGNLLVLAIERAVHALLLKQNRFANEAMCYLITDQAFAYARRWCPGDSVDVTAQRIIKVICNG